MNYSKRRNKRNKPQPNPNRAKRPQQKRKMVSNINPNDLIKEAQPEQLEAAAPTRSFDALKLHHKLADRVAKKGFVTMTPIQDQTIEQQIKGRDVMGIANTGTGKTGAFIIPIIHKLLTEDANRQTLILVPTRELALQVEHELKSLTSGLKIFGICLIGGTNINRDITRLKRRHHVVIATPGRLLDLMKRRAISIRGFSNLVLDEFDRMLDMGFVHDVKRIEEQMANREQTILFSATESKAQRPLIEAFLHRPIEVRVSNGKSTAKNIDQRIVRLEQGEAKFTRLLEVLRQEGHGKVIVFEETKRRVSRLSEKLNKSGIKSDEIHGNRSQNQRVRTLNAFRQGKVSVLVATDVAARGIDIDDITHVINYQLPQTMDSYIHRIGRTGRAGKRGQAITFIDPAQ